MNVYSEKFVSTLVGILSLLAMLLLVLQSAQAAEPVSWTLPQAIDYALAHNPDLAVMRGQTAEAEQARLEVFGNFLPTVNLEGGYTYIGNPPVIELDMTMDAPIPGMDDIEINREIEMGYHDNYLAQVTLQQVLFASGQIYYGHRAMQTRVNASLQQEEAAQLQVAQRTAQAYLGVLMADQVAAARRESLRTARAHQQHVQNRYDAGAATEFELLRAQVEVSNIEPQVIEAEKMVQTAIVMLHRVTGLPEDAPVTVLGPLPMESEPFSEQTALQDAARERPELQAINLGIEAAQDAGRAQRGGMLPAVMLTGSYGYQKPYYTIDDWEETWTIGVGVRIPLFDGLKSYRGMKRAQAQAETLTSAHRQSTADIRTQVHQAALDLRETEVRIAATRANHERAQKVIAIAEQAYAVGAATSLEVIDAQLAATNARVAYLKALYDYRIARVALAAASGDLAAIGR